MNDKPLGGVAAGFQDLVAQVPDLVQPLIIALAGTIPFVEGELAAAIGVYGGLHPIIAGLAAATGNLLCVILIVTLGARGRSAIVNRAGRTTPSEAKPPSKGREKFQRWVVRFGVPGASVLGPLAIPTQFTSAILVGAGIPKGRIIFWQAIAIVLWTTVVTVSAVAALAILT